MELAAQCYYAGRFSESEGHLQRQVGVQGFSRLRWFLQCNILACRMQQQLLAGGGAQDGLQALVHSYRKLWEMMRGVHPTVVSLPAEMSVLLSLCQLEAILGRWGAADMQNYLTIAVTRIRRCVSPPAASSSPSSSSSPSPSQSLTLLLPALQQFYGSSSVVVRCVEKMAVIASLVQCVKGAVNVASEEDMPPFSQALAAHSKWLEQAQATQYREVWEHYRHGDYQKALDTLSSTHLHPSPLTPHTKLLAGVCYARQGKLSLALSCWRQCLAADQDHTQSPAHILPALQNCCVVYKASHCAEAGAAMRRLELQALQSSSASSHRALPVWLWQSEGGGVSPSPPPHRSLVEATYCLAWEAMELKRYQEASEVFSDCIIALEGGDQPVTAALPHSLPPPSTLHLLRARCLMYCRQWESAKDICTCLLQGFNPSLPVLRSEVMCVCAVAALHSGSIAESRQWSHQCLKCADEELVKGDASAGGGGGGGVGRDDHRLFRLQQVQSQALVVLALVSIAHGQWREALQLLGGVVTTPTGLYNYCLLQCRLGHVGGGARGWLEGRGKWPQTREEGREQLEEAITKKSGLEEDCESRFLALDIAMLSHWLQHHRK